MPDLLEIWNFVVVRQAEMYTWWKEEREWGREKRCVEMVQHEKYTLALYVSSKKQATSFGTYIRDSGCLQYIYIYKHESVSIHLVCSVGFFIMSSNAMNDIQPSTTCHWLSIFFFLFLYSMFLPFRCIVRDCIYIYVGY